MLPGKFCSAPVRNLIPGKQLGADDLYQIDERILFGREDYERIASLGWNGFWDEHYETISRKTLEESVRGHVTPHHRFMIQLHLDQVQTLEMAIATVDQEVGKAIEPFRVSIEQLKSIPGVSDIVAHVIVAEIGTDMSRFPTSGHLLSWAPYVWC